MIEKTEQVFVNKIVKAITLNPEVMITESISE